MKIVVFTGAGVSAESGLNTFRDNHGLWHDHKIEEVATPEAFDKNPQLVLDFYNQRQKDALAAQPNGAHLAVAELEKSHDVTVVTQNVDDLHERAGSTDVVHLHGQLDWARISIDENLPYPLNGEPILLGDKCELGHQLRPHIVWFGEWVPMLEEAASIISKADVLIVIGTSLSVYPAAGLVDFAPKNCEKYINALALDDVPFDFEFIQGKAASEVPNLVKRWL